MPTNDPRPTKAVRRDEARAKAAQMRKEQERKAKRNRILAIGGLVVAVVALVAVVFSIVNQNKANEAANSNVVYGQDTENVIAPALADVTAPAPANDKGGIPVSGTGGDDVGAVGDGDVDLTDLLRLHVPATAASSTRPTAADIDAMLEEGGVTITYHPVSILDRLVRGQLVLDARGQRHGDRRRQVAGALHRRSSPRCTRTSRPRARRVAPTPRSPRSPRTSASRRRSPRRSPTPWTAPSPPRTRSPSTGTWRTFAPWSAAATNQAGTDVPRVLDAHRADQR